MNLPNVTARTTALQALLNLLVQIWSRFFGDRMDPVLLPADLAGLRVEDGTRKRVTALRCCFVYAPASTVTADGLNVIASTVVGRWLREAPAPDAWGKQTDWYIDPAAGSDLNPGTAALPIRTLAEWYRRTGGIADAVTMDVHLLGDIPTTDSLPSRIGWRRGGNLRISGTRTEVATGVLTNYTAANFAGNAMAQLHAAADFNWTPYIGRLVRITECNAWVRVAKDLGGGVAGVTVPGALVDDNQTLFTTPAPVPAGGNTFTIYSLSALPAYAGIQFVCDARQTSVAVLKDVRLVEEDAGYKPVRIISDQMIFFNRVEVPYTSFIGEFYCAFCLSGIVATKQWVNFTSNGSLYVRTHLHLGGYMSTDSHAGRNPVTLWDTVQVGGYITVHFRTDTTGSMGLFDGAARAVRVRDGAEFKIGGTFYGSGNTGLVVDVGSRSAVFFTNAANITVAGGTQLSVGGVADLMPDITASNTAVLPALASCDTFAKVAAAPFSGKVFNYRNGAYVGPVVTAT